MPSERIEEFKRDIHWPTVLWYIHLHALGFYGFVILLTEAKWMTVFFALFTILFAGLGITIGAHRLWAHRAYEASGFLRFLLMIAHTLAGVGSIYDWVLNHRTHHQYYGTERDPYNHKRGFFYSHVISNLLSKHPEKERLDRDIDMCDVDYDGYVWAQRWFYWILFPVVGLLLPINAPAEYWDETIPNSLLILGFFRLSVTTNISWLVNSAALVWGLKPGDKYPVDENSIFLINKSYWPNYHYLLPWDYKCGEFGTYDRGCSTFFVKMLENLGLIDALKTASTDSIREALYQVASKKTDIAEALESVKDIAEEETVKAKLRYRH
ncbi:acyl-CoA Delta(11) desaturase [Copidosoma floridanum]|uniref:acyl-CoA Delta(11) desaturase n=1 Tax=Copidosoma floridanum TaxID=29053 RepID=UPI0006C98250|nr:acyl-CoA Delta(11) desaturase [Copidosoma floridanum]